MDRRPRGSGNSDSDNGARARSLPQNPLIPRFRLVLSGQVLSSSKALLNSLHYHCKKPPCKVAGNHSMLLFAVSFHFPSRAINLRFILRCFMCLCPCLGPVVGQGLLFSPILGGEKYEKHRDIFLRTHTRAQM